MTAYGSDSITTRSLNVPGSDSSALQMKIVRMLELLGHGLPLDPGGERGAAATQQLRIGDLSEGLLRSQLDRPPQRLVPVVGPVVVDRGRVDGPDATQQPKRRPSIGVPRLWRRRHLWVGGTRELLSRQRLGHQVLHLPRIDLAERRVLRALARRLHQCDGRAFAHAETRAAHPGDLALGGTRLAERGLQRVADQLAAAHPARQVVTGVDHDLGSGLDAEHRVEGGDAVGLGGRHRESFADVVEATLADPSHPGLQGVQGGQQQVALLASRAASPGHAVRDLVALGAVPTAGGFAQEFVDRLRARPPRARRASGAGPRHHLRGLRPGCEGCRRSVDVHGEGRHGRDATPRPRPRPERRRASCRSAPPPP